MALPKDFKAEQSQVSKYTLNNLKTDEKIKIRVLSEFIDGKSVWGEDKEGRRIVTRRRKGEPMLVGAIGVNKFTGKPESIKQFIAAVVYNYTTQQLEVFETDKSTIIGQIVDMENNEDWGDCREYDLTISRTGEKMETKYSILPSNKTKFAVKIDKKELQSINLDALYVGGDPFSSEQVYEENVPQERSAEDSFDPKDFEESLGAEEIPL